MVVVSVAGSQVEQDVDPPSVVRERLEEFAFEVLAEVMNRPVQVRNGGLYLRGVSPHCDGERRARIPQSRAAEPFSPAAGLTLPKAVLLLQPLFKCWTGRCRTCQRRINVDRLTLTLDRRDE